MADSPAVRAKRARLHKAGDHSTCDPSRCRPEPADEPIPVPDIEREPGGIEKAVTSFVASLGYPDDDPRSILGEIAVQLARRVDETGALPAAVRELRVLLAQIAETPNAPGGKLDEVRVHRARRRLDALIGQTG